MANNAISSNNPLVSIITVVFNGEMHLEQTIQSVINQDYENIEYIIVDGKSNDGTIDIINKYQENITIWISEEDDGLYDAMNKGISLANGEIVGIINADDFYNKQAVSIAVRALMGNEGFEIFFGKLNRIYQSSANKIIDIPIPESINKNRINVVHPTVFMKKSLYSRKNFDTTLKIAADLDLLLSVCSTSNVVKSKCIISNMRTGGLSSNFLLSVSEMFKVYRKHISYFNAIRLMFLILVKKIPAELLNTIKS